MTLAAILSGSIIMVGLGTAIAHQNNGMHQGSSGTEKAGCVLDEKAIELRNKFHDATTELRKKMFTIQAEMRALMHNTAPDSKEAGKLAGELFDVKEQLGKKAEELGISKNKFKNLGFGGGMTGHGMNNNRSGGGSNHPCGAQGGQGGQGGQGFHGKK